MIDVLDVEGNGLLHATCGKSCQSDHNKTPDMLYSTKDGRIEIIGILLGKSSDVNVLNNEGQSVLHAACVYGDTEIVDILLRSRLTLSTGIMKCITIIIINNIHITGFIT
jgi:ankyrin repeat protein